MSSLYLVTFDISDDRERTRVGKVLLELGSRVQKSVFEVMIDDDHQREALMGQLLEVTSEPDGVRFYRICERCRGDSFSLSGEPLIVVPESLII
jgi:CRISPR-associated protein Cas2